MAHLAENNLQLVEGSANRMTITARGTRSDAERMFAVNIRDYLLDERKFYAINSEPTLPESIAQRVQAVNGLSNLARPQPMLDRLPDTQANRALWYALCANQAVNGGPSAYTGGTIAIFRILYGEVLFYLTLLDSLINIAQASDLSSSGTGQQYAKCVNMSTKSMAIP